MIAETKLRHLMSKPVRRFSINSRVEVAAAFLRRWGISGAAVLDVEGRPVGVFSLSDLAAHRAAGPGATDDPEGDSDSTSSVSRDARVSDYMTPGLVCLDPDATLKEAALLMTGRAIHRVFVRRGDGPLQGVVTTMDALRWVAGVAGSPEPAADRTAI